MNDKKNVIEGLEAIVFTLYRPDFDLKPGEDHIHDAIILLKEQEEIKEQFIEAFKTIRDAYNTPSNREKILLNYLLRNACCCAD